MKIDLKDLISIAGVPTLLWLDSYFIVHLTRNDTCILWDTFRRTKVVSVRSYFESLQFLLLPEQEKKAIDLQHYSDDGPANQHHKHTSKEETGGLHLVFLEEEAEGPLQPNDKGQSSNKQNLQQKKKPKVVKLMVLKEHKELLP